MAVDPKDNKANSGEGLVQWRLATWFPELTPKQLDQLKKFHDELMLANKTFNLIGPKTIIHADAIHFADSILAARHMLQLVGQNEIYDLGSGNGFPGVVMAILSVNTQVTLVDNDPKKAEFLSRVSKLLGLTNVKVLATAVEKLPEASFQYAVCRGFASISRTVLILRKPVRKGGVVFHMKGEEWFKEVSEIPTQLCSFWRPSLMAEYRLPIGEVNFGLVRTDKFAD